MVSILALVSHSSSLLTKLLGTVLKAPTKIWYQRYLHVPQLYLFSGKFQILVIFPLSLISLEQQNPQDDKFFFSFYLTLVLVI